MISSNWLILEKYRNYKCTFDEEKAKSTLNNRDYANLKKRTRKINKLIQTLFRRIDKTDLLELANIVHAPYMQSLQHDILMKINSEKNTIKVDS